MTEPEILRRRIYFKFSRVVHFVRTYQYFPEYECFRKLKKDKGRSWNGRNNVRETDERESERETVCRNVQFLFILKWNISSYHRLILTLSFDNIFLSSSGYIIIFCCLIDRLLKQLYVIWYQWFNFIIFVYIYIYRHVLVTTHRVWIGNSIYSWFITSKHK
jgi:hypothetical protein